MTRVLSYDKIRILENALLAASKRHEAIAHNIANANTPGFRRTEVRFEDALARALGGPHPLDLRRTDPRHLPGAAERIAPEEVRAEIVLEADTYARNDRSNVNPEIEMVEMAKNSMWAQAVSARLRGALQGIREIIQRSGGA